MTPPAGAPATIDALDAPSCALVDLAVTIAIGREPALRSAMSRAASGPASPEWIEELVLQSYLFVGFPRALNAAREWRRASGRPAPALDEDASASQVAAWRARGVATCAAVYGDMYARLRANVRELHPALDLWMIVDGYGKVLGRPGLDLRRRELCIVAVCAVLEQDRQLHAHLHGALNAGATPAEVDAVLAIVARHVQPEAAARYALLWTRVRNRS